MSWRLLRRIAIYGSLGLFGLLMLTLAGAGYLLHSENGSRWLVGKVQQLTPGELRLERFGGSFTGPLQIQGLVYSDGELSVAIQRIQLDWKPLALLEWRLHLLELSLQGARLTLPVKNDQSESAPAEPFAGLRLPLELTVEALRIEDFQLVQAQDAEPLVLERLYLQVEAGQQRIRLTRLEVAAFSAQLVTSGSLELSEGLPVDLTTEWSYQLPDGPQLQGEGKISGSLRELQVSQTLAAPLSGILDATLFELEQSLRWEALLQLEEMDVGAFAEGFPARISGRLRSTGSPQQAQADGRLELDEPSLGRLNVEFKSNYRDGSVEAEQLLVTTQNGSKIEGQGRYSPDHELGTLAADLKWNGLRWPLVGKQAQFRSREGSLHLEGRPEDYHYRLDLDTRLTDLPQAAGRLKASGKGDLQGLILDQLFLAMQEGRIEGKGQAAWKPEPSWQMQLTGKGLNPGLFNQDFPGKLALGMTTRGRLQEHGLQTDVVLQKLEGELRGYPLRAEANVQLDAGLLKISSVKVRSGANQLDLQGTAGDLLNLTWVIKAPELDTLWPELAGDLDARGMLSGKTQLPHIEARVKARQLVFKENRIDELGAEADLDLAGNQQLEVHLQAKKLVVSEQMWDALLLDATGLRDNHHIEVQLQGSQAPQVSLGLDAGLGEDYTWTGSLQRLWLDLQDFGRWELETPANFSLGSRSQSLQRVCLKSDQAGVCAAFKAQIDKGSEGTLQATDIPFSRLQSWLPEETRIAGRGNLKADFTTRSGGGLDGNAILEVPEGSLHFELGGEPKSIDFTGGLVTANLDGQSARCKLNLPLIDLGGIQGDVVLPGLRPMELDLQTQPVKGLIKARVDDLGLLGAILPSLQNIRGAIAADFSLDGTLADPGLKGDAALKGGALDIPELGIQLREMSLDVVANDLQRATLDGSVRSGDGKLKLSGETELNSQRGFPTELLIKGENWVAVNIPEAEVHISPDITIKYQKERTELNGEVLIPYARVRPREMPETAVSGSPDLVVVGGDKEPEARADPRFYSKLRVIFGDRVSFEGMGLRANLAGNLLVTDEPDRPVTGSGRVGVVDGTYKAYGQDLKIERGFALFADSPVDNPGLDVRAVREVEGVTAGLRITGTLKKPEISLFSMPAMSDSEVLSYLITGRAPGESSGSGVGISTALQAAGAGNLASEVGRQFGLEELRVETGGTLEEASVVAGTYLSPRLYVQYVNELATGEAKLRLRYDLTKRIQIQTESGQSQGVDIFYTIER